MEGKHYVWDDKELRSVLEKDYNLFAKYYDISENGNWEGKNILIEKSIKPTKEENEKLKKIKFHPSLTIKTDSKYLIDGMEKWISNWKKKGWKTASGKPVLNQDLWKALDHPEVPKIKLQYVKGHRGEKDNDRVDAIAVAFSKGRKIQLKDFV